MTDHYEDAEDTKAGRLSNAQALGFVVGFWFRRKALLAGALGLTLVAIAFDLATPWAAGGLVDALAAGPDKAAGAWRAWAIFVGVYLAFSVIRNVAFRFWNPLAARNM